MTKLPPDQRARARIAALGKATIRRVRTDEPAEFSIRDLSASGARLVGRMELELVEGDRVQVVLELGGAEVPTAAEVVRTDRNNSQVAIAFRDLSPGAAEAIERAIAELIDRARANPPRTVLVLRAPDETVAALERDIAQLGRSTRACRTMLEAMWSLHDPSLNCAAVIVGHDIEPAQLADFLEHLADHHPHVIRVLLFEEQLGSVDHAVSSVVDAVLRTPLRIRAVARALGMAATDSSVAMLPVSESDA